MEIVFQIGIIVILSILSGILGRMGGAGGSYKSWMRDWLIPVLVTIAIGILFKWHWLIIPSFVLLGFSLTTYWDSLFGFDNLFFSGFTCGLSAIPLLWWGIAFWAIIGRATILAVIWGSLNKIKYDKILFWRRDVAEEFLRYMSIPLTLLILR